MSKFLFAIALVLVLSESSFGQPTTKPATAVKINYQQKSKQQRNAANTLLWGGFGVFLTGLIIDVSMNGFMYSYDKKNSTGSVIATVGLVSMAGSIPLFIAYNKNKRKAASLSFENEIVPQIGETGFADKVIPSLIVKISL